MKRNGNIFFTSDFHFNHANIIKYAKRPFASVAEMNREMVRRYNSVVSDMDTVYILGDIAFGRDLDFAARLRGRKLLLAGNHDTLSDEAYQRAGFAVLTADGIRAKSHRYGEYELVHAPHEVMRTVCPDMRDMPDGYRDVQAGGFLDSLRQKYVCGHVHGIFRKLGSFVNVSVDVWDFLPVSLEALTRAYAEPDTVIGAG